MLRASATKEKLPTTMQERIDAGIFEPGMHFQQGLPPEQLEHARRQQRIHAIVDEWCLIFRESIQWIAKDRFVYTGERVKLGGSEMFPASWPELDDEEAELAQWLYEELMAVIRVSTSEYFISSREDGPSIQVEGGWLETGHTYYVRDMFYTLR